MSELDLNAPYPVDVVLRRWTQREFQMNPITALMPTEFWNLNNPNIVGSYEHIGQHGGADYNVVISRTVPTDENDADAKALLDELRSIGYSPRVRRRRPNWRVVSRLFQVKQEERKKVV